MAEQSGRNLYLDWHVNFELNKTFDTLFPYKVPMLTRDLWDLLVFRTERVVKVYNHHEPCRVLRDDKDNVIWVKSWYRSSFHDEVWSDFSPRYLKAVQSLRPHQHWIDAANRMVLPNPTYGCHIRVGDIYSHNQQMYATNLYKESSTEAFIRDMKAILQMEPDAHFFVATEFPAVMEQVTKEFEPGRIIPWPEKRWIHRSHDDGLTQGLVEMLILGRCQAILGSEYSQYSELAAEWGNIPIWIVHQAHPLNTPDWKRQYAPLQWPINW
jgi:hypothetical protein